MWLSSAIQETLQPPCAWELLEAELLEHICAEVKRAHPSCDVPVEGEESLAEALEQTKGAARALAHRPLVQQHMSWWFPNQFR